MKLIIHRVWDGLLGKYHLEKNPVAKIEQGQDAFCNYYAIATLEEKDLLELLKYLLQQTNVVISDKTEFAIKDYDLDIELYDDWRE